MHDLEGRPKCITKTCHVISNLFGGNTTSWSCFRLATEFAVSNYAAYNPAKFFCTRSRAFEVVHFFEMSKESACISFFKMVGFIEYWVQVSLFFFLFNFLSCDINGWWTVPNTVPRLKRCSANGKLETHLARGMLLQINAVSSLLQRKCTA